MADYDNNMRGVLFVNDKGDNPNGNRPDYKGNCEIDGKKYLISSWKKTSQKGVTFLSMSLELDDGSRQQAQPQQQQSSQVDLDDSIPF